MAVSPGVDGTRGVGPVGRVGHVGRTSLFYDSCGVGSVGHIWLIYDWLGNIHIACALARATPENDLARPSGTNA